MTPGDSTDDQLLEVGRIGKPHGLLGEVVVHLHTDRPERLTEGATFTTPRGELVVERSRPHQGHYLVQFAGVFDRTGAEHWRGVLLMAPAEEVPGTLWIHELVGAEVVTVQGDVLGRVASVLANPASDLLVLESGGLIPLRFVISHEPGQTITVEIPDGLLD